MMEKKYIPGTPYEKKPQTFLVVFAVVLILLGGIGTAIFLIKTKPKVQKGIPTRQAPLVEVISVAKGPRRMALSAMGTVIPSAQINLKAKISGEVIHVAKEFVPGGLFKKNDIILSIDPQDYDLAVKKKESLLNHAKANLDLELGRQDVAREELHMMQTSSGKVIQDNGLALRKPQLDQARAEYDSAMVDLESARLDRLRTVIRAPFNGLMVSRNTHVGAQVSSLESLATLVNTNEYWVEASIPLGLLSWITLPKGNDKPGNSVLIINPAITDQYTGQVIKITGQLNEQSRLAKVLVRINDPLSLQSGSTKIPLLLGDYVNLRIDGGTVNDIIALPRSAIHEDNQVWVLENERLFIRKIQISWSDDTDVFVNSGIEQGDFIIISNLSGVIDGMSVRSNTKPDIKQDTLEDNPS
ncbi:MAG: efflux RND transporter periplasmic adaptor subunit [Proteobacteria bacterium]|nr:efflux RND transporter periplasmic adaptor subunit [Pseudomonadota bacterium]